MEVDAAESRQLHHLLGSFQQLQPKTTALVVGVDRHVAQVCCALQATRKIRGCLIRGLTTLFPTLPFTCSAQHQKLLRNDSKTNDPDDVSCASKQAVLGCRQRTMPSPPHYWQSRTRFLRSAILEYLSNLGLLLMTTHYVLRFKLGALVCMHIMFPEDAYKQLEQFPVHSHCSHTGMSGSNSPTYPTHDGYKCTHRWRIQRQGSSPCRRRK